MEYVIGIDGGGTKTKLTMCTFNNGVINVIEEAVAGPSNVLASGVDVASESLVQVIKEGVLDRGYKLSDCRAMCMGIASGSWHSVQDAIAKIMKNDIGYDGKLIVTNDAETALMAGTGGKEGILLIAGTGSICYGVNSTGKSCRIGGWGHIFDDEGSAYYIAIKILNAVMKAYDGRDMATVLTKLVLEYFKVDNERDIVDEIYKPNISKQHIADLAKLIEVAYDLDDPIAIMIVDDVVNSLYISVESAMKKLSFLKKPVDVVIDGSVIVKNQAINLKFSNKLKQRHTLTNIKTLEKDASYGAAIIACRSIK